MIHPYEILSPTSLVGIGFTLRTVGAAYHALGPAFQGWKFCVIAVDASRIWTLAEPKKDIVFEAGV
jgi:hypothetical protein